MSLGYSESNGRDFQVWHLSGKGMETGYKSLRRTLPRIKVKYFTPFEQNSSFFVRYGAYNKRKDTDENMSNRRRFI